MDLFNFGNDSDNNISTDEVESPQNILIWTKKVRKSINIFMHGWNLEKSELAAHHKHMKKKLGCNGSLKKNQVFGRVYDNSGKVDLETKKNVKDMVFHLQSGRVDELIKYLVENGINEDNIEIKSI